MIVLQWGRGGYQVQMSALKQGHRSRMAVTPMPPAVQTEISPRFALFSSRIFANVATMRAPVAAKGCPMARLPPFTFNFDLSILPRVPGSPSLSRQNALSVQAL